MEGDMHSQVARCPSCSRDVMIGVDDNPCDVRCVTRCRIRFCSLCNKEPHFPATCLQSESWFKAQFWLSHRPDSTEETIWDAYKDCQKQWKRLEEIHEALSRLRNVFQIDHPQKFNPPTNFSKAYDEIFDVLRLMKYMNVVMAQDKVVVPAVTPYYNELCDSFEELWTILHTTESHTYMEKYLSPMWNASEAVLRLLESLASARKEEDPRLRTGTLAEIRKWKIVQEGSSKFSMTEWRSYATWRWDTGAIICAICRYDITEMCVECQAARVGGGEIEEKCTLAWGIVQPRLSPPLYYQMGPGEVYLSTRQSRVGVTEDWSLNAMAV